MSAIQLLLLGVFAAALMQGASAQASRYCLQGGLREAALHRDGRRLAAYVVAIGVSIGLVGLLQITLGEAANPSRPAETGPDLRWGRFIVGGLLFGAGLMLARSCPVRTLEQVGQGSVQAVLILIVMALSADAMSRTDFYANAFAPWRGAWAINLRKWGFDHQDLGSLLGLSSMGVRSMLSLAIAAVLLVGAWRHLPQRSSKRLVQGAALNGAAVAAGYALTAGPLGEKAADEATFLPLPPDGMGVQSITFSGPLGDAVYILLHPSSQTLCFGVVAVAGALQGALLSARVRHEFHWQTAFEPRAFLRRCIGAVLVGGGAVLSLGCSVGHGLSGISVLSVGSMLGLAAILAGAWISLKVEAWIGRPAAMNAVKTAA